MFQNTIKKYNTKKKLIFIDKKKKEFFNIPTTKRNTSENVQKPEHHSLNYFAPHEHEAMCY